MNEAAWTLIAAAVGTIVGYFLSEGPEPIDPGTDLREVYHQTP